MKNFKKIISSITALAISASMFAGLSISASAETEYNIVPSESTYIDHGDADTNFADAGVVYANYAYITDKGIFSKKVDGAEVGFVKFDVSEYLGKITNATINVTSTCADAGKNSGLNIAHTGAEWSADTLTWNNQSSSGVATAKSLATLGYPDSYGATYAYDVSEIVRLDEDGVVSFAFYTLSGRRQSLTNLSLDIVVADEAVQYATITEKNVLSDGTVIWSQDVPNIMYGESYSASSDALSSKLVDGKSYIMDSSAVTTIDEVTGDTELEILFKEVSGEVFVNESFSDVTNTWGFTTNSGVSMSGDAYLKLCTTNGSTKTDTKSFDGDILDQKVLDINFKWATEVDLNNGGNRASVFSLRDENDNVVFAISGSSNRPGMATVQKIGYGFDDNYSSYTQVSSHDNNFYTINLKADFVNGKISGTIANSAGAEVASFSDVAIEATNLAGLKATNISSLAPMRLDDFFVMEGETQVVTYTVTNASTSEPVEGAVINVNGVEATTDANGTATMNLPDGTYTATVACSLYAPTTAEVVVAGEAVSVNVPLAYLGVQNPASVVISGGAEGIYKPAEGTNTTSAFSAVVYDEAGYEIETDSVTWSLQNGIDGVTISEDGIVSVTADAALTDDNGLDLVVRATSVKDTAVYAEKTVHIYNIARVNGFTVDAPMVLKDGLSDTVAVTDIVDQYGVAMEGDFEVSYTVDNENVTVENGTITANTGVGTEETVTLTAKVGDVSKTAQITVYGYDYYEPGRGEATYGEPRMAEVNGEQVVVFPGLYDSAKSTTVTLPKAVELANGSAKKISFKNTWMSNTVYTAYRQLTFKNSSGVNVLQITYTGKDVVIDATKSGDSIVGTVIGSMGNAGEETEAVFILKTDADGNTTAALQYNGTSIEAELGTDLADIASYTMSDAKGVPAERYITLTDLKISDSDVAEVEVKGADNVAIMSNKAAKAQYTASIFSTTEGETFTWSVSAVEGVSIDQNGVLTVENTVAPETVVTIKYASDINESKFNTKDVTIKDYANVVSFNFDGPMAVDCEKTAQYTVNNIVDEYGNAAELPVSYSIVSGGDIAEISADGVLWAKTKTVTVAAEDAVKVVASYDENDMLTNIAKTAVANGDAVDMSAAEGQKVFLWKSLDNMVPASVTTSTEPATGEVVVMASAGNPGKTLDKTIEVLVGKFYEAGEVSADSVAVDVTKLTNYSADTQYLVTVLNADGTYTQTEVAATDGVVTVDTTGAANYEVSPIYTATNVGDASKGVTFAVADGLYDVTVKKSKGQRGDIEVNDLIVGNNVDQYGSARSTSGSEYTAKDVYVTGGKAVVSTGGYENGKGGNELDYITVKKAASILDRKQHVYVLGDSLVATYYGTYTSDTSAQTGWGQVLDKFLTDDVNVTNLAESGNYAQGLYETAFKGVMQSAKAGDILIFECGYNDRNYPSNLSSDSARYANMQNYMELVYEEATAKGVDVVFVTPNASTHGTGWKSSVQGTGSVIEKAEELGAKCFNLSGTSFAYMEPLGTDYCYANLNAEGDALHSSYFGAMIFAGMVADGLANLGYGDIVNADASYTLTDTAGATITVPVN